jgi:hypothetical protein
MSILAECLRSSWAPGLNEISGNVTKDLRNWLADEGYQIYAQPRNDEFRTSFSDNGPFLSALAADVNRMATAAYESISQATKSALFPKSTAWIIIKSYYASFFAAHATLRMLGKAVVNLEHQHTRSVNKIAKVFGTWTEDVSPGSFCCELASSGREVEWQRFDSSSGGVHEQFWAYFAQELGRLSDNLLTTRTGMAADNQLVSVKLAELAGNLHYNSNPKGTWLSGVRNRVNYRHDFGAWYPYRGQSPMGSVEERLVGGWLSDPVSINLTSHNDRDLRRFQATCSFIVATCRVLAADMAERCSAGRSFHSYGWLAISRLTQQRSKRHQST